MARMSVRRALTYRAEWLFGVLRQVAALWIQLAIWRALLANGVADTGAGTITLADMVTYLIVVNVVMAVVHQRLSVGSQIDLSGMGADVSQSTGVENGSVEVN